MRAYDLCVDCWQVAMVSKLMKFLSKAEPVPSNLADMEQLANVARVTTYYEKIIGPDVRLHLKCILSL
jgi:hypothetical protein